MQPNRYCPNYRPPLSKDYLLKDEGFDRLLIQPEAFYRDHNIEVRLGTRATRLDAQHKLVTTGRAGTFRYRQLLIATGARVRRLRIPGVQLEGVHYLRTVTDAERLRKAMATSKQAVVVASSFIAMEVAAACITRGIHTTIIAKEKLLYDRLESPEVSAFFCDYYRARGIEIVFGETVSAFTGEQQLSAVTTRSGRVFACDLAVIGAGAEPEIDFLRDSGLRLEDGVVVTTRTAPSCSSKSSAGATNVARLSSPPIVLSRSGPRSSTTTAP